LKKTIKPTQPGLKIKFLTQPN